ncbi:MAG: RNA polymerase sigma factor [Niabella sp.]
MAKLFTIQSQDEKSDEILLEDFKNSGSQEVLAALFLRYSDLLYGVCLKYLEDAENAKDAVMNIYQELWRKLPNHDVSNFKSWLYVLAKNYCLMQLRSAKKTVTVNIDGTNMQSGDFSHLDDVLNKEEAFKKLENCIETLSEHQKSSIKLFYYNNKCYNEIAAETGLEWNKVRSLIQNARRNLKICMDNNGS